MKAFLLLLLGLATTLPAFGQYSATKLTRKVVPPPAPPQPQRIAPAPPAQSVAPVAAPKTPADQAKAQAEKNKNESKQLDFYKKRAEEGSDHAQYELGLRYLAGKGTAPNAKLGREWLEKAAKKGNAKATEKLAELGPAPKAIAPNSAEPSVAK